MNKALINYTPLKKSESMSSCPERGEKRGLLLKWNDTESQTGGRGSGRGVLEFCSHHGEMDKNHPWRLNLGGNVMRSRMRFSSVHSGRLGDSVGYVSDFSSGHSLRVLRSSPTTIT